MGVRAEESPIGAHPNTIGFPVGQRTDYHPRRTSVDAFRWLTRRLLQPVVVREVQQVAGRGSIADATVRTILCAFASGYTFPRTIVHQKVLSITEVVLPPDGTIQVGKDIQSLEGSTDVE